MTGAALRTHPLNLVLAQPSHDEALDVLVDRLLQEGQSLPGVIAALPELEAFVGAWTSANDLDATRLLPSRGLCAAGSVARPGSSR